VHCFIVWVKEVSDIVEDVFNIFSNVLDVRVFKMDSINRLSVSFEIGRPWIYVTRRITRTISRIMGINLRTISRINTSTIITSYCSGVGATFTIVAAGSTGAATSTTASSKHKFFVLVLFWFDMKFIGFIKWSSPPSSIKVLLQIHHFSDDLLHVLILQEGLAVGIIILEFFGAHELSDEWHVSPFWVDFSDLVFEGVSKDFFLFLHPVFFISSPTPACWSLHLLPCLSYSLVFSTGSIGGPSADGNVKQVFKAIKFLVEVKPHWWEIAG